MLGPHQPGLETKVARLPGKRLLHGGPWLPPSVWGRNVPPGLQTFLTPFVTLPAQGSSLLGWFWMK